MKILIVGSGGREHVIGEKISKNPNVDSLYFAPGNGGTIGIGENIGINGEDIPSLLEFAKNNNIDFTVVGPEVPLSLGIVDSFQEEGLKIFGPNKETAQLESSKAFAKDFMIRHKIPTAKYLETTSYEEGLEFAKTLLREKKAAVIKADGLCSGKGVFILNKEEELEKYLKLVLEDGSYGQKKVVIEEFLEGFEMSLIALIDNTSIKALPTSKDHKNIYDNDQGPNTGGMGTYSPNFQGQVYLEDIEKQVLVPFFNGIKKDGLDFRGVIFFGLMITQDGIKVLEFNTRFGDPETQSILNKIDNDLLDLLLKTEANKLNQVEIVENDKNVVTLVLASQGYPEKPVTGFEIDGLDKVKGVNIYHSGTKEENGKILTSGGRVLSIVAVEDTMEEAISKVYREAQNINYQGKYFRGDIGSMVKRFYVEKKDEFSNESAFLREEIKKDLDFDPGQIRIFDRFDIEGIEESYLEDVKNNVLYDKRIEDIWAGDMAFELEKDISNPLVVEFQKGQFNEKEYTSIKNIQLLTKAEEIFVKTSKVYSFGKDLGEEEVRDLEGYIINNTNQVKGKLLNVPSSLRDQEKSNRTNEVYEGFINLSEDELKGFLKDKALAMSIEDLKFIQDHYKELNRDINETELYILDTYWSDHCRHTTFNTILNVKIKDSITELDKLINSEFEEYLKMRKDLNRTKEVSLMDLGTIVAKYLKTTGDLDNVEKSDEVNACSIVIDIKVEDRLTKEIKTEEYLLMFKNETHNHPTEIEPYGGAHTCIGGGIRDPLSGRAYVYQAMRITGGGNPTEDYKDTIKGKLSQKRIFKEAAEGYSTYGNEIGLAGGLVEEIYNPGFVAKRMELGALVGACKKDHVLRANSEEGDLILLLGAKTGRDGIGAATGSSTEQEEGIIEGASPEVQRGNPPLERNIIRLFRNPEATVLIKKSNDFGAGGVSVAIGELADSLDIYLDRVPLKYPGLNPREIAIAESQERMAVVISKEDKDKFISLCESEDIETTLVAEVTNSNKMIMYYEGEKVCELDRDFLNSSGVKRYQEVEINSGEDTSYFEEKGSDLEKLYKNLEDLNYVSKKNLYSKFDYTIGRGTVLSPLGGKNQITPIQAMAAIIPTLEGNSKTASIMSYGYDPNLSESNQFLGGYYAVIESLTKIAAVGGNPTRARLSFQEFFESLGTDKEKWAKPMKSLLGAFYACRQLKVAPIGGKDSMSGTYKDSNVPPTLFSFGVVSEDVDNIISPELKGGYKLGIIRGKILDDYTLDHDLLKGNLDKLYEDIKEKNILSAYSITYKGLLHNLVEMSLGNDVGFSVSFDRPFDVLPGSILVEYKEARDYIEPIGLSGGETLIINKEEIDLERFKDLYLNSLDSVYQKVEEKDLSRRISKKDQNDRNEKTLQPVDKIKALVPIFPGTTGEYDIEELLLENNIEVNKFIFKVEKVNDMVESLKSLGEEISKANLLIIPSGMVNGDEPNNSGKMIASVLLDEDVKRAVESLISREGLILGIGSGFQGLLRTGLVPFGKYTEGEEDLPILAKNVTSTYVSSLVNIKFESNNSPWLKYIDTDKTYLSPLSTGFGRLVISKDLYKVLGKNDQIAARYVENLVGSDYNIESLMSPCGRILGRVTNFERVKEDTLINVGKLELQDLIKGAVEYFKK